MPDNAVVVPDEVQAERDRCRDIHAAFRGIDGGEAKASELIEAGADIAEARGEALVMLRASRKPAPNARRSDEGSDPTEVGVAAYLQLAGRSDLAASLGDESATKAETIIRQSGGSWRLTDELLANYAGQSLEGSFSNSTIVSETIRRVALDTFSKSPEAWRQFAHRTPLSDFKENKLTRLAGTFQFSKVGEGGELKHGTLSDEQTSIKLDTAGAIIAITRQARINDDIQLLKDIPSELAAEASRSVGDDLFTLLNGSSFWTTGTNQLDGAGSALGIDAFGTAVALLRNQTDSSGRKLNLGPRWLVVPPALEAVGRQLLTSTELGRTDGEGTSNPWRGSADLLIDARIGATEWFLFAENRNAAAVVGLLNGKDAPQVEQVDPPSDQLGEAWRAYFDYGVALHESRAAIKSLGQ